MLLERAEITVKPGSEEAFHQVIEERGRALLGGIPGVRKILFGRGVENPQKFVFLVEWESMEAHGAFPSHPTHAAFRELFMPYSTGGAMEHFEVA